MGYLDIILCIPLIWGLLTGFMKGLIVQVASILALVLGIYGAIMFSNFAQDFLLANFQIDHQYLAITAFAMTFIGIVVGVYFLGKAVQKLIDIMALGFFNKLLGAVFGLIKFMLVLSALLFVFDVIDAQFSLVDQKDKDKSVLYGPLSELIPTIAPDARKMVQKTGNEILS